MIQIYGAPVSLTEYPDLYEVPLNGVKGAWFTDHWDLEDLVQIIPLFACLFKAGLLYPSGTFDFSAVPY